MTPKVHKQLLPNKRQVTSIVLEKGCFLGDLIRAINKVPSSATLRVIEEDPHSGEYEIVFEERL